MVRTIIKVEEIPVNHEKVYILTDSIVMVYKLDSEVIRVKDS